MKINTFEDLEIWKLSVALAKKVYQLTANGKFAHDFGLKDQLQRSTVSISSNIVEGFERNSNNEFIRFLKIAKGSAGEARNQLHISLLIGYITQKDFDDIATDFLALSAKIGKFISYLESKRSTGEYGSKTR